MPKPKGPFLEPSYLHQVIRVHSYDAEPQDVLLPLHAFGQLQQCCCEGCLRQALAEQSKTGGGVNENMHPDIPDRGDIACGPLRSDDDVVDREDYLRVHQLTIH